MTIKVNISYNFIKIKKNLKKKKEKLSTYSQSSCVEMWITLFYQYNYIFNQF